LLQDTIPELRITARLHLIDVKEHHLLTQNEVSHVAHIMDGIVPADVAAYDHAVINTYGEMEVAEVEEAFLHMADADPSVKRRLLHLFRQERIRYPHIRPIGRIVAIAGQYGHLIGTERPIGVRR